ncbi:dihydroorotate dehydrogenase electron transfer subunit [Candidatus Termititenax aidoneus]|uniref:Dihydroorotate dehydrogenase electron transfer subunit n=1 Tax=Termititenax aidoneus TaxID=2218524 RepID=A0A388TDE5_TERA1|nr:dihydroorotate dehydrogenase electron transfer subunit [Candidatus Termititenax aidoneus]
MKKLVSAAVVSAELLNPSYLLLTVDTGENIEVFSGQFAMLSAPDVFLRRPFSVHDADGAVLSFLIKIAGPGTRGLAGLKTGAKISLLYPLGNGFRPSNKKAVLVGGGCGSAPLLLLAKQLKNRPVIVLGGRTKDDILRQEIFARHAELRIATEDGSLGVRGLITEELKNLSTEHIVYACGPEPMLKSLHKLADEKKFELQVSLESVMACGVGACLGCVTNTRKAGHVCVCATGPVFAAEDLPW